MRERSVCSRGKRKAEKVSHTVSTKQTRQISSGNIARIRAEVNLGTNIIKQKSHLTIRQET